MNTYRHDNPPTSAAAAACVDCETHRAAVERVFRRAGCPLTAQQVERLLAGLCSPESVRRCVREMARDRTIEPAGEKPNRSGCKATAWWWIG